MDEIKFHMVYVRYGFSQRGGGDFFHVEWPVGCEKLTLRKLSTLLQASSVLPYSKKLQNHTGFFIMNATFKQVIKRTKRIVYT